MPNSRRGLWLLLLGVVLAGGAAWQTWQFEQQFTARQLDRDRLARQYASLELTIADLKNAQAGYVAAGQGADFWMTRFDELADQLEALLIARRDAADAAAQASLTAALAQLEALGTSDQRARRYVGNDQRLLASDVIYVESLEILSRLSTEVTTAREVDWAAASAAATRLRVFQASAVGAAGALLLILLAVAVRTRPAETPAAQTQTPSLGQSEPAPASTPPAPPVERPAVTADMVQAADVCVDLARLLDGRDLPALLARAADAIQAKGLVLWVIDDRRETLTPSLAHGYSERTVQKLGTLPVSADNVTAVACRTMLPQTVPGALAVPLIGTAGCVGVLAAEVTGATAGSVLPVARIIAAQLSAVISPVPAAQTQTRPAAGAH